MAINYYVDAKKKIDIIGTTTGSIRIRFDSNTEVTVFSNGKLKLPKVKTWQNT